MRKQQAEMQAVYEKYGSTPMSGCLPMLISLPIMFALYRVIYAIPAINCIHNNPENPCKWFQDSTNLC